MWEDQQEKWRQLGEDRTETERDVAEMRERDLVREMEMDRN